MPTFVGARWGKAGKGGERRGKAGRGKAFTFTKCLQIFSKFLLGMS
jgi:hypothetical protein